MQFPIEHRYQLLDVLWQIQQTYGYIPDKEMDDICEALHISRIDLEGVITFYHFFSKTPRGKYTVYLNNSITCQYAGYNKIKQAFERSCGTKMGHLDPTGTFGLFETSCIGLNDQEPAAIINLRAFTNLTPMKVQKVISSLRAGKDIDTIDDKPLENIRYQPEEDKAVFFRSFELGSAIGKLEKMGPDAILDEIQAAGLTGLGGAFFPTHIKWRSCRQQEANQKYIVCNADEGEPGTFKDRVLMMTMPGLLLEGMIAAGYVAGASEGIIYLRAEYRYMRHHLLETIDFYRQKNWLGKDVAGIKGFDFDIRVQLGAGAYVCGEETALLHSMEGKRGEPRAKVYFPTERGFLGKPTIVNNVETLMQAARILELGSEHFRKLGTERSKGTKVLSVSGDCLKPGIYEIEWGTTLAELMEMCGGNPYAVQLGGPAGYLANRADLDRRISLEDLRCGGSVIVYNDTRDIMQILTNYNQFFVHESCGICTPCRAGNYILGRKLAKMARGLADDSDVRDVREWGETMRFSSRCGLGQTAPNSIVQAVDNFPKYFEEKLGKNDTGLNKGFDMEAAVKEYEYTVSKHKQHA